MPNPPAGPDLLSVQQVATELNITPRAVRHRIEAGTLAATKLGPGTSAYVITRAEVDRLRNRTGDYSEARS